MSFEYYSSVNTACSLVQSVFIALYLGFGSIHGCLSLIKQPYGWCQSQNFSHSYIVALIMTGNLRASGCLTAKCSTVFCEIVAGQPNNELKLTVNLRKSK